MEELINVELKKDYSDEVDVDQSDEEDEDLDEVEIRELFAHE